MMILRSDLAVFEVSRGDELRDKAEIFASCCKIASNPPRSVQESTSIEACNFTLSLPRLRIN
jgi:hypothetical protein